MGPGSGPWSPAAFECWRFCSLPVRSWTSRCPSPGSSCIKWGSYTAGLPIHVKGCNLALNGKYYVTNNDYYDYYHCLCLETSAMIPVRCGYCGYRGTRDCGEG